MSNVLFWVYFITKLIKITQFMVIFAKSFFYNVIDMLQFIAQPNDKYSIPEQVQMALEGGCQWIRLRVPDYNDEQLRELAAELVPLCKENLAILTIENHVDIAKDLGMHGVHLSGENLKPTEVRDMLGPEAIIGAEVTLASTAMSYVGADIDYVTFPPTVATERIGENIAALRQAMFELPIVAEGEFKPDDIPSLLQLGINGIAVGREIGGNHNPVKETEQLLDALTRGK